MRSCARHASTAPKAAADRCHSESIQTFRSMPWVRGPRDRCYDSQRPLETGSTARESCHRDGHVRLQGAAWTARGRAILQIGNLANVAARCFLRRRRADAFGIMHRQALARTTATRSPMPFSSSIAVELFGGSWTRGGCAPRARPVAEGMADERYGLNCEQGREGDCQRTGVRFSNSECHEGCSRRPARCGSSRWRRVCRSWRAGAKYGFRRRWSWDRSENPRRARAASSG